MQNTFGRIFTLLLIILVPTFFCSLLSSPISYALPLNCPKESKVIGIECFGANYNNTTPWYRKDFGPTEATFPFWLAGFTLIAISTFSRLKPSNTSTQDDSSSTQIPETPKVQFTEFAKEPFNAQWLPTNCPNCGGAISSQNVEWVSNFEAKCPYCGSVLKQT